LNDVTPVPAPEAPVFVHEPGEPAVVQTQIFPDPSIATSRNWNVPEAGAPDELLPTILVPPVAPDKPDTLRSTAPTSPVNVCADPEDLSAALVT
jgi:hypothetical protein